MLQYRRHDNRRAFHRSRSPGGSRVIIYIDGFPHIHSDRSGDGERHHLLSPVRGISVLLIAAAFATLDPVLEWLQVPADVIDPMRDYLWIIYWGIGFTFLYNYFAALLRAVGDSVSPLLWLACAAVLNIGLDLLFILRFNWGIEGAAAATVISQAVSGIGLGIHTIVTRHGMLPSRQECRVDWKVLETIAAFSSLTCIQQSVMNLGILAVQEFGNAFSTFIAQNYGAGRKDRIRQGTVRAVLIMSAFSIAVSAIVFIGAVPLMQVFVSGRETEIIRAGAEYLKIEGAFYIGIGLLFILYGYYRAVCRPGMSVILTVLSLGTRVALSYILAPIPGIRETGIWWSIPAGWALADLIGIIYYFHLRHRQAASAE